NRSGSSSQQSGAVDIGIQGHVTPGAKWEPSKDVEAGEQRFYEGKVYAANSTFTTGMGFTAANWTETAYVVPGNTAHLLMESSFGQPFAQWLPYEAHASEVYNTVHGALYPALGAFRSDIDKTFANGGKPFRFKELLYDRKGADITQDFDNIAQWFGTAERAVIEAQIKVLRAGLVTNPLDTNLRNLYLDIFHDLLVADIQIVKKDLVALGKLRLGLDRDPTDPFIIFDEIDLLESVVNRLNAALQTYGASLADDMEGVDPSSFDADAAPGMPFGLYIFASQQPRRQKLPSRFTPTDPAEDTDFDGFTDVVETIAGYDPDDFADKPLDDHDGDGVPRMIRDNPATTDVDESGPLDVDPNDSSSDSDGDGDSDLFEKNAGTHPLFDGDSKAAFVAPLYNEDPLPGDPNNPEDIVLGSGYKDYSNLLEVLAQFIRQSNELARLRGLRQDAAHGDLTKARDAITEIQGPIAEDYCFLKSLFGDITFLPTDTSGVRGGMASVEYVIADSANVRTFLNGETNLLGLDENFLLIVPSPTGNFDSFDSLRARLQSPTTEEPLGPLKNAIDLLGTKDPTSGAIGAYEFFRNSLDKVVEELGGLDQEFEDRYLKITGYLPDAEPGFEGVPDGNAEFGSELDILNQVITNLKGRLGKFKTQIEDLQGDMALANQSVSDAEDISRNIIDAAAVLDRGQSATYDLMHLNAGAAATAQAVADTVMGVAGSDAPWDKAAAGIAGGVNAAIQGLSAVGMSMNEETLARGQTAFDSKLALAEAPLAVTQAKLALGEFRREVYALQIEQQGDLRELGQAQAEVTGLLRELERIEANRDSNVEETRGRFYADPIHLVRSDLAILKANAAFRNAQRWVWYTQRALEYKWSAQFIHPDFNGDAYDRGAIFMMRNALELQGLVKAMADWDGIRTASDNPYPGTPSEELISFRNHILSPNPKDYIRNFPAFPPAGFEDDGLRFDLETGETVSQLEHFHRILERHVEQPSQALLIPFNTTLLEKIGARFFTSHNFADPSAPTGGTYRDKIVSVAVNIVATPQGGDPTTVTGSLFYGGETYFRTRIPRWEVVSTESVPGSGVFDLNIGPTRLDPGNVESIDFKTEFIVSTFRKFFQPNFNKPIFVADDQDFDSFNFGYNQPKANLVRADGFKEYSVAATKWLLKIDAGQYQIDRIQDIELYIEHNAANRTKPIAP
ncbi:MAG: hypothetical protein ACI8T1_002753, partial [Verrucomicrobiales bacterium]